MSRRIIAFTAFVLVFAASLGAQTIPAFPGAEGAGAYAKGGRAGDVYHVTNTNASGAGSLAYGLTTGVPVAGRTIVFDVSGFAHISGELRVIASKITIAGQTAPGDGFGLKDGTFRVSGDDIVIRHLRFRDGNSADAINLDSGSLNSIFDHCDAMLSNDENMSSFGSPPENLTFQWSLNAWGMESHSCGGLWDQNHATCHHSLWAHNHTRNPKARPSGALDWVNNVTFDWDIGFIMGDSESPASWKANVRGNYFVCPPGNLRSRALEKANLDRNGVPNFSLYVQNNLFDKDGDNTLNGLDAGYGIASGSYTTLAAPVANNGLAVTIDDPLTAYKKIVSAAGPLRLEIDPAKPLRDDLAAILINNLVTVRRHHVSNPAGTGASNGGFGTLNSSPAPIDTDRDGMPDYYETALGWTPGADDHATVLASSGGVISGTTFFPANTPAGYTRLEEYLHFLAIPHGSVAKNVTGAPSAALIDLRKFTSGFSTTPTFSIPAASVSGGSVALSGPGNALVMFTPTLNFTGRARFDFTVTDAPGSTWTQTCALLVSATGLPRDLLWKGDSGANNWDEGSLNWLRNATPIDFTVGDSVTFDLTGSNAPAINCVGAQPVPSAMIVDAPGDYTFTGSGSISASGPLTKRGAGNLTFSNATTSFPAITVEAGTLTLGIGGQLSGGKISLLDGATFANRYADTQPTVANPLEIPAGHNVTIKTGNRLALSGAVTGGGTVNFQVETTVARVDLRGAMAAFTGDLRFTNGGGVRLFFNGGAFNGFDGASVDLGGSVSLQPVTNSGGNTCNIGSLAGSSAAANLAGGTAGAVTYSVGAAGENMSFAGSITGNAKLTKVGAGALTLSGASTHAGATAVNAGALVVSGSLGNTPLIVASGARLMGNGTLGGAVTVNAGAILSPQATMNLTANLTLNGATLPFDLTGSPVGVNDRIAMSGGALAFSGTQNFQFALLDGTLAPGVYDLITGAGSHTGTPTFTHNLPGGARQTFDLAFIPSPRTVRLTVTGNPAALTWTGAANATWDTTTFGNWTGASPNSFANFDAVLLDDSTANRSVLLSANVAPRSTTIATTAGYALSGSGALTGSGALAKTGVGPLTISNTGANTFTGGTTVAGSAIEFGNATANSSGLGAGSVTLDGGTVTMFSAGNGTHVGTLANAFVVNTTGRINAVPRCGLSGTVSGSGVLTYFTPYVRADITGDWSGFTGQINVINDGDGGDFRITPSYYWPGLGAASVYLADRSVFRYDGTLNSGAGSFIAIGELTGGPLSTLLGGITGGRNFTYTIGAKTAAGSEAVFAGTIAEQNATTATSYVKTGLGAWRLNGVCAWNGGTVIEAGILKIGGAVTCGAAVQVASGASLALAGGSLTTDAVNVATGATLTGNGTITGDLNNGGTLTCGTGALTVTGDVVNSGTMRFTGGAALHVAGEFTNNGLLDLIGGAPGLPANFTNNGIVLDRSNVRLASASKNGAAFTVTITGYLGHTYQMQRADTLAGPWSNVGSAQSGAGALTFTDSGGATGDARFYRIAVGP